LIDEVMMALLKCFPAGRQSHDRMNRLKKENSYYNLLPGSVWMYLHIALSLRIHQTGNRVLWHRKEYTVIICKPVLSNMVKILD
jgi:hypothetical protein